MYVADCGNNRIQRFQPDSRTGKTIATQLTTGDSLKCPSSIILDGNDNIYFSDTNGNRILRIHDDQITCLFGCTSTSNSQPVLKQPWGLSFDTTGNLFVADTGNHRIIKFILSKNINSKL